MYLLAKFWGIKQEPKKKKKKKLVKYPIFHNDIREAFGGVLIAP